MKRIFSFLILLFATSVSFSQSISGNFNAETSKAALGYGNVDIYQGDKLVASVLTDKAGNFNVKLDTGMYRCVLNYAGFKPVSKLIHVTSDEKADFTAKADPAKPKPVVKTGKSTALKSGSATYSFSTPVSAESSIAVDGAYKSKEITTDEVYYYSDKDTKVKVTNTGQSNKLTAGEINDFSKWVMWQDLVANELLSFQKQWNVFPQNRYTVEVHGKTGIPAVDAVVRLTGNGKILFTARTDNTGKAELWQTLTNEPPVPDEQLQFEVDHQGKTSKMAAVSFQQGINHQILNFLCKETENVDIAFVVDATGSMQDELNYLQAEMNDIIYQSKQISSKLNFSFANVFYRDGGDEYLTRSMDFNRILSESVQFIDQQNADGGGDYEEAVEIALDSAINGLSWSKNARARILFLILDAPPHNTATNQAKLQRLIHQAAEKGIRIVPIGASGINKSTEYLMRSLSLGTNGTYTFLTNHSGIGNAHIEPSTDHYEVETLNSLLVRIVKSYTYMPDCNQKMPDLQLNYPDSLVVVSQKADSLTKSDSLPSAKTDPASTIRWKYYPNPSDGIVNIEADLDIAELYITDLSGKVLQIVKNIEKQREVRIDLSNYASGIYLIRYPLDKTWVSGKVVLQRKS